MFPPSGFLSFQPPYAIRIDGPNFGSAVKVFIIFAIGGWLKEKGMTTALKMSQRISAYSECGSSVGPANLIKDLVFFYFPEKDTF